MISWRSVYRQVHDDRRFVAWFSRNGRTLKEQDFELRAFKLPFENLPGSAHAGTPGPLQGPIQQTFDYGAIIVGLVASSFVVQQAPGSADYAPSFNGGRRDTFVMYIERTDDEPITAPQAVLTPTTFNQLAPGGLAIPTGLPARVLAEGLTGSAVKDVFPQELLVAPSQGLSVAVASLLDADEFPTSTVHVCFHAMVPRVPQEKAAA